MKAFKRTKKQNSINTSSKYQSEVIELARVTEEYLDLKTNNIEDKLKLIENLMREADSNGERMVIDACLVILNKMLIIRC